MSFHYLKTPWPRGSVRGYTCEGPGFESWPVNFFILDFLFKKKKKNRHEEHKGNAMIFMCDKKCQTAIF